MQYQIVEPSHKLKPFIKNYWIIDSGDQTVKPEIQRIFTYGCIELNIYYKDGFQLLTNNSSIKKLTGSVISGQKKTFQDLISMGMVGVFSVIFNPHAAELFFDIPMEKLMNENVRLREVTRKNTEKLEERIAEEKEFTKKVQIVETFLIQNLDESKLYDFNRMNSSINRISKSFHTPRINDLAALTCLGEKQFERKFGQFVGMKPMQFIRSIRFQRALHLKRIRPNLNLTQLALEVGYYDQAHFTNEFKIFTGMTPKKYFSQHNAFSDYFDL